jgi:hypothetical protein
MLQGFQFMSASVYLLAICPAFTTQLLTKRLRGAELKTIDLALRMLLIGPEYRRRFGRVAVTVRTFLHFFRAAFGESRSESRVPPLSVIAGML